MSRWTSSTDRRKTGPKDDRPATDELLMLELDELLTRARAGDRPALESLIGRHQRAIAGFVLGQV